MIAACYLMRAAHLWKNSDVNVLDIGAGDANRHDILRFAGGGARMTTDAAGVVDDLRPLHVGGSSCLLLDHLVSGKRREIYHGKAGHLGKILPKTAGIGNPGKTVDRSLSEQV